MKRNILTFILFAIPAHLFAQPTFKVGWNTYKTGYITHIFVYTYKNTDSLKLYLTDSSKILSTTDSLVMQTTDYPVNDKNSYKTVNLYNTKKLIVKTEEYKNDDLLTNNEWRYDDKNRKAYHLEENKVSGGSYRKTYDYITDRKKGTLIVTENAYYNGKIEFYTKSYYDKKGVKYKEIRLNDNNKDVIHIETYTYDDYGRMIARSVYFPEFKVTKKFTEEVSDVPLKCYRTLPLNTVERLNLNDKIAYIKKVLLRNKFFLSDKDCREFSYKFTNGHYFEILVATTKVNNERKVTFRYRERVK